MPALEDTIAEVNDAIEQVIAEKDDGIPGDEEGKAGGSSDSVNAAKQEDKKDDERKEDARSDSDDDGSDLDDKSSDSEKDLEDADDQKKGGSEDAPPAKADAGKAKTLIGDETLARAVRAGLSVGVIRTFPSDAALNEAVSSMEQVIEAQKPPEKQEEEEDPFADIKALDPEKYEPEVIEMRETLLSVMKKQHEELRAMKAGAVEQSQQSAQVSQDAATREVTEWFDKKVEGLGKNFHESLGKGGINSLTAGSSQFLKRERLANKVAVLLAGSNAAGIQASRDEVFDDAASLVLRDEYQKVREEELSGKLAKRSKLHIQRADGRNSKSKQSPFEDIAAELDAKFFARK